MDDMNDGPGLTCLYKAGTAKNFEASEVERALQDDWHDTPQPLDEAKRKPGPPKLVGKQD